MPFKGETGTNQPSCLVIIFSLQAINYGEKSVAEMKSVNENCFKSSFQNFQKSLTFREIDVKYLEKNSIEV